MQVLIVESPGKIEKIKKLLGKNYDVLASCGHIMDLDPSKMSVDIENNFTPSYITYPDKSGVINRLKMGTKGASKIYIAADEDREGEMIGWSVAQVLKLKNPIRITFNSITKKDIMHAINNPGTIDYNLVNAQKARRILDRIVGYELSPLLNKNLGFHKLSAGRVQSVVTKLCVDRETEILRFLKSDSESYFKIQGIFSYQGQKITTVLYDCEKKDNKGILKGQITKIPNKDLAYDAINGCTKSEFKVANVFFSESIRNPSPPFTTSTLQQEASRKLGFSVKRTMMSAQRLYEAGLITYMRTDSVNLSNEALDNIKKYVLEKHNDKYYQFRKHASKSKNTQEAHEAVRSTDVFNINIPQTNKLGSDEQRLYSLIWKRTVASQMSSAKYDKTTVQIVGDKIDKHFFMTTFQNLKFDGFLIVYNVKNIDKDEDEEDGDNDINLKNIKVPSVNTILPLDKLQCDENYLKPPSRYSEASLIDKLDPKNLNIGRPATYGPILAKIMERGYVEVKDISGKEVHSTSLVWENNSNSEILESSKSVQIGGDTKKFVPTQLGIIVTCYLVTNFPNIMDYKFTAEMENKLDDVASGQLVWTDVLDQFYSQFRPLVIKQISSQPNSVESKLLGVDPKTGNEIYATMARYGYVIKSIPLKGKTIYAPIKEPLTYENITHKDALKLLEYPRELGKYNKKLIKLNKGKYGLYITHNTLKLTIEDDNITLEQAIEKIKENESKQLASLKDGNISYTILDGPYGKYINIYNSKNKKKINVPLPKNEEPSEMTLDKIKTIVNKQMSKPRKKYIAKK